ncbi:hypothetical protein Smic_34890 [Streptomyces microflavus]|uniref:Uncharacterized protein n=1 Tax=Streptomyces microflavus TaxID=1919 RepID=A0A7J0CR18_STRMI|nr:hypothetical protein Smic_34890 [Streptomyces microflavus]
MGHPTKDRRITLERIESYLPERSVRIEELGERLGLHRAQLGVFRKFYGLDTLRFDPELPLLDLLRPAARAALEALPEDGRVDYLAYAHTTQAVARPTWTSPRWSGRTSACPTPRPSASATRPASAAWAPSRCSANCSARRAPRARTP